MGKRTYNLPQTTVQKEFLDGVKEFAERVKRTAGTELVLILTEYGASDGRFLKAAGFYAPYLAAIYQLPVHGGLEEKATALEPQSNKKGPSPTKPSRQHPLISPIEFAHQTYKSRGDARACARYLVEEIRKDTELQKHAKRHSQSYSLRTDPKSTEAFQEVVDSYKPHNKRRDKGRNTSPGKEYLSLDNFAAKLEGVNARGHQVASFLMTRLAKGGTPLGAYAKRINGKYYIADSKEARAAVLRELRINIPGESQQGPTGKLTALQQTKFSAADLLADHGIPIAFTEHAIRVLNPEEVARGSDGKPVFNEDQVKKIREMHSGPEGTEFRKKEE